MKKKKTKVFALKSRYFSSLEMEFFFVIPEEVPIAYNRQLCVYGRHFQLVERPFTGRYSNNLDRCSLERVEANEMTGEIQSHIYYPGPRRWLR